MWNHNLQTLLVGTIMAVSVSLSGCDSTKDDTQNPEANAESSEQTVTDAPANTTDNSDTDAADNEEFLINNVFNKSYNLTIIRAY